MTKTDILKQYLSQGGDITEAFENSFSCYNPNHKRKECRSCIPCFRRFVAFAECGYVFSESILEKVIPYIGKEIIPYIMNGTYKHNKREGETIVHIYNSYKQFDK